MRLLNLWLLILFFSGGALADEWTNLYLLSSVQPLSEHGGGMLRVTPPQPTNPAGCTNVAHYDVLLEPGLEQKTNAIISAIYMAFAANHQIKFYIDSSQCSSIGSPIIRGALVFK